MMSEKRRKLMVAQEPSPIYPSPQWSGLSQDLKLKILRRLDPESKIAMKQCCSENRKLVESITQFNYFNFACKLCDSKRKWYFEYWEDCDDDQVQIYFREWYDTAEEAYQRLKTMIKSVQNILELYIDLEINSKVSLCEDYDKIDVMMLTLRFIGGYNNDRPNESYNFLLRQLTPESLQIVRLKMGQFRNDPPALNDKYYDFVNNREELLCEFHTDGITSFQQLLKSQAYENNIWNSTAFTPLELASLILKMITTYASDSDNDKSFFFYQLSPNLETFLFGQVVQRLSQEEVLLVFNSLISRHKLKVKFTTKPEGYDSEKDPDDIAVLAKGGLRIEMMTVYRAENDYPSNYQADRNLKMYPSLQNLVDLVAQEVTSEFELLYSGATEY